MGRINPISAKRREQMKIYAQKRKAFLKANPKCAVFPSRKATDVHHMRGRAGALYLSEAHWLAVSREGHHKINENPTWAREMGFLCAKGQWGMQPDEGTHSHEK